MRQRDISNFPVRVLRSKRKTLSLEICPDLTVVCRVPKRISQAELREFLQRKESWLTEHYARMQKELQDTVKLSKSEREALREQAREILARRLLYYAPLIGRKGVSYHQLHIRFQRTRWGSCSMQGNLNFNALLALCPGEVQDYVVVHELCHRVQMNHSERFWAELARVYPEYKRARSWLREHGRELLRKI